MVRHNSSERQLGQASCEQRFIEERGGRTPWIYYGRSRESFFLTWGSGCIYKDGVWEYLPENILIWNKVLDSMPQALFRFTRKAMLQVLPTNSNLAKQTHTIGSICSLCGAPNQTNKHVLSNCSAALDRYKIRHNNILVLLANWLASVKSSCSTLCVDVDGSTTFRSIDTVFQPAIRPDLVLFDDSKVAVLELTICHESNLLKSRSYKLNKYSDFKLYLNPEFKKHKTELFSIEISVLGFISNITDFCCFTKIPDLPTVSKVKL